MEAKVVKKFTKDSGVFVNVGKSVLVLCQTFDKKFYETLLDDTVYNVPKECLAITPLVCYCGQINQTDAERLLSENPLNDAFIVRSCESDGRQFTISIKESGIIKHVKIENNRVGKYSVFGMDFDSVNDLCRYYTNDPSVHYLNKVDIKENNVWCGSAACKVCCSKPKSYLLDGSNPGLQNKLYPKSHYLLFDTNTIINKIDLLEEDLFYNVIISLDSVQEIKNQDFELYKRLESLINNQNRKFFIFENHNEKIELKSGESIHEMRERAAWTYTNWYNKHFSDQRIPISVVYLTDKQRSYGEAMEREDMICTVKDYIYGLPDSSQILQKLSNKLGLFFIEANSIEKDHEQRLILQANAQGDPVKMRYIL